MSKPIVQPKSFKQMGKLPDMSTAIWYVWAVNNTHYRVTDFNGRPGIDEYIRDDWYPMSVPADLDPIIYGIAQLTKRLSRAECTIEALTKQIAEKGGNR